MMVNPNRQQWNEQQQVLQRALARPKDHPEVMDLFLSQHAQVYPAAMSQMAGASGLTFEDELWQGLSDAAARRIPPNGEHSIAWLIWHSTRCEDITLNLLVAGAPQVLLQGGWHDRMQVSACDTGNAMSLTEIATFSAAVDLQALKGYRLAVGRRTREIVRQIPLKALKQNVEPSRLQRVLDEGAVVEAAGWLIEYWGGRTFAGLLLMPATRHHIVHLNEALRIKQKLLR